MQKRIVTLEYEIRIAGGELLESSDKRGPLRFVSGSGQLLPALEERIDKLGLDQEESGVLKASEAFGDLSKLPVRAIPRSEFPASEKLDVGRIFEAGTATGEKVRLMVVESDATTVSVRYLHALHEKDIAYRVKVLSVEDANRPPALPASALDLEVIDE
ncbi:MAG TPA: FKBP-type peptidyl-prolyl cis-trans isomerase [Polyangia bacterium]|jgi:FKBP-type peptidyl-prolyl cis-trans isomerase 2